MTLLQQFILIALLPLSFLMMSVYLWRRGSGRRRVQVRWLLTLLSAAVWASSILRLFVGTAVSSLTFLVVWATVGTFAFSLTAIGILATTVVHLNTETEHSRVSLIISLLIWIASIILSPTLWPNAIPDTQIGGQIIHHFDLWAAVWIVGWFVPLVSAFVLSQRAGSDLPASQYRTQVRYWLLMLLLFFVGFTLSSIQQPGQPSWQQSGVLVAIAAALLGTLSLTQSYLPELQFGVRRLLGWLTGPLIVFLLTWGGLWLLAQTVQAQPPTETAAATNNLILLITAALFAAFFAFTYRRINAITHRIFLPKLSRQDSDLANYANIVGNLPTPTELATAFLRILQSTLDSDDIWFYTAHDGPGGQLVLRPLTTLTQPASPETISLPHDSPFAAHLRHTQSPLMQYDINTLDAFATLPPETRATLDNWQRVFWMPLHAGESLIAVVSPGSKASGETYSRQDIERLQALSQQVAPLFAQAQNLRTLRYIADYAFQQNQSLIRDNRHLRELTSLYAQFIQLVSPDLRRPFAQLDNEIRILQKETLAQSERDQIVTDIKQQIKAVERPLDNLITLSARIQTREQFHFQSVHLDEIIQAAMRRLRRMAEARRVQLAFNQQTSLPPIFGDVEQLREAMHHLLHNAIKFNKIGGTVQLDCGIEGSHLYVRIIDTGVGIPEERLAHIWSGFHHLNRNGTMRGTGLGLALARFIIAAHGGRIDVKSNYGSGSTFAIYLPLILETS